MCEPNAPPKDATYSSLTVQNLLNVCRRQKVTDLIVTGTINNVPINDILHPPGPIPIPTPIPTQQPTNLMVYSTPGAYTFTAPRTESILVRLWGAGGGR